MINAHKAMGSLEEYQPHPFQPVFLNKNGEKLNPRGLHKIFIEILQKAGLSPQRNCSSFSTNSIQSSLYIFYSSNQYHHIFKYSIKSFKIPSKLSLQILT